MPVDVSVSYMYMYCYFQQDLLRVEADQNRELEKLQNRQKHLTWKLESLTYVYLPHNHCITLTHRHSSNTILHHC